MAFKIGEKGVILGDDGQPIKIGDEVVSVESDVARILKERLTRDGAAHQKKIEELIETYEDKLKGTLSAEERQKIESRVAELEGQLADASTLAQRKANETQKQMESKVSAAEKRAELYQNKWREQRLSADINAAAIELNFRKSEYLSRWISPYVKWEEVLDDKGKVTDEWQYYFVVPVKGDDGKVEDKRMTLEEVAEHVAQNEPSFIRGSGQYGSGNGDQFSDHHSNKNKPAGLRAIYNKNKKG